MIQQSPAKTKSFLKAINKAAMQKCNDIAKQIEETTAAEMQRAEDEARRDGHQKIELAKNKIEMQAKKEVAAFETEKKKEIYAKRRAYQEEIFSLAAKELSEFAQSAQYQDFLEACLANISDKVGNSLTFTVAENDKAALAAIAGKYPAAAVKESKSIHIGGFTIKDSEKGLLIDETLDTRLSEQLDWFLLHCNLKIEI